MVKMTITQVGNAPGAFLPLYLFGSLLLDWQACFPE